MCERWDTKSDWFRSQLEESYVSSHTVKLYNNETVFIGMTIYTLSAQGLTTLAKELTVAYCVMQNSSNEMSTPLSDSRKILTNES